MKDKQKFIDWIDDYNEPLFKHALWMTGNRALAEDLVQETFYQAWKSQHSIKNEDNPLSWLLTVLRRAVYKEYQQARLDRESFEQNHIELSKDVSVDDLDLLVDLGKGLMALSTRQRELLLLHSLHGFTYEQIGKQLAIPVGTVMSRIARARQALRDFYSEPTSEKSREDRIEKKVLRFRQNSKKA